MTTLNLSENAITILEKRYLDPNETPYDRYKSLAEGIAKGEKDKKSQDKYSQIYFDMFASQEILPNSPAIMNYGKPNRQQQGSACFVLSIKDNLNDIFDTIRRSALIHKSGGGTGYNFSSLRPNGAIISTTGKASSGVIPFIVAYNAGTGAVSQGGARRGANMGILNCTHPDIIEFIKCKEDKTQITNFNLSVGVTERFFEAVMNDEDWELYFENEDGQRIQFYPNGDETKELVTEVVIKAKDLYNLIVEHAHSNGEPGIIFIDRLQSGNSVPNILIDATNPCGEQPLPPENSCVLASFNLAKFLNKDNTSMDWKKFDKAIKNAVRLLDDIVTVNDYPIEEIKIKHDQQRRIGLGLTGLGDTLILLGISYSSKEGREVAGKIMKFINDRSHYYSYQLGKERGNFPLFEESKFNANGKYRNEALSFYKQILANPEYDEFLTKEDYNEYNIFETSQNGGFMRNAATTTIAPTGSLTTLLGAECYGCEPVFALGYERNILGGEKLVYVSDLFKIVAEREGFFSKEIEERVAQYGSAQVEGVPDKWKEVFKMANEISVNDHIAMQAELQKYCDSGISKTINMSFDATLEDVNDAYMQAYESGILKGITVYRDASRESAPITIGTSKKEVAIDNKEIIETDLDEYDIDDIILPIKRPKSVEGTTIQCNTGCGKTYFTINHDENGIIETFAFTGSSGGCQGLTEGLSRVVSLAIRQSRAFAEEFGLDVEKINESTLFNIIDQLRSVRCNVALRNKNSEGKSCPDILGKVLLSEYEKLTSKKIETKEHEHDCGGCSECANKSACKGETTGMIDEIKPSKKAPKVVEAKKIEVVEEPKKEPVDEFHCPECGRKLERMEGCMVCICGRYSKCN